MPKETTQQKQRSKTDIALEQHTRDIWGYVRNHQNSLDSERACKMIRAGFNEAVADVRRQLDEVSSENDKLREERKDLMKQVRALKKEQASEAEPVSAVAVRMDIERRLRKIGATDGEVAFLLSCELPDVADWCEINLDDLRRSQ